MKSYAVEYEDPCVPGTTLIYVIATNPKQAEIKANVMYYGETRPTVSPKHSVHIREVALH